MTSKHRRRTMIGLLAAIPALLLASASVSLDVYDGAHLKSPGTSDAARRPHSQDTKSTRTGRGEVRESLPVDTSVRDCGHTIVF